MEYLLTSGIFFWSPPPKYLAIYGSEKKWTSKPPIIIHTCHDGCHEGVSWIPKVSSFVCTSFGHSEILQNHFVAGYVGVRPSKIAQKWLKMNQNCPKQLFLCIFSYFWAILDGFTITYFVTKSFWSVAECSKVVETKEEILGLQMTTLWQLHDKYI